MEHGFDESENGVTRWTMEPLTRTGAFHADRTRQGHPRDQDFIEFDSMIDIRPSQGNRTRSVDDPDARATVIAVVDRLVQP